MCFRTTKFPIVPENTWFNFMNLNRRMQHTSLLWRDSIVDRYRCMKQIRGITDDTKNSNDHPKASTFSLRKMDASTVKFFHLLKNDPRLISYTEISRLCLLREWENCFTFKLSPKEGPILVVLTRLIKFYFLTLGEKNWVLSKSTEIDLLNWGSE